jgi:hypothetical protein
MLHRQVSAEVRSAKGAADIVVETNKYVYIIEIKLDASAEEALRQINEKNYAAPYLADGRKVTKVGVNLSCKERTITSWLTD